MLRDELSALGLRGGHKAALYLDDGIEYITVSLAVLSGGGVIVPVSPSLAWDEVEGVVRKIDVDYLISSREIKFPGEDHASGRLNAGGGTLFVYHRKAQKEPPAGFGGLNPAFIRFSSGTTSASKGVVISHESIYDRTNAADKGLHITAGDNIVWILSMSYHFVVTIILFLRKAATIILCGRDFPAVLFDAFNRNDCTFMYASPFHYRMMMNSADVRRERLRGLRMAVSTAVEFTEKEIARFFDMFGVEISEAYGIIEVGLPFINAGKDPGARGSVGKILPDYQIRIRDKDGEGVGVICLKGKGLLDAYYSPWQTRDRVLDRGWFDTGDLGFLDGAGRLFIRGREKNVINFAGMKIFPMEVEGVLNAHPDVRESFVYGVPHDVYGQLPQADVVPEAGADAANLARKLRKFCYGNIASYKVPKEIRMVREIQKTTSGKVLRCGTEP